MLRLYVTCCFIMILGTSQGQQLNILGKLPPILKGVSGMEYTDQGDLLMVNDHGRPVIYYIDQSTLDTQRTTHLNNRIRDWEDLTLDDNGNLYVGDFGNNKNSRRDLKIYKVPNLADSARQVASSEIIEFTLSDQTEFPPARGKYEFDIEAFIYYQGQLYLFSKSRGVPYQGLVKLYKLDPTPGKQVAQLIDSTYLGNGKKFESWITGADIMDNRLALLTHGRVFLFSCFKGDRFFQGHLTEIDLQHYSQKEALCFKNKNQLLITDELTEGIMGGNLYSIQLPPVTCQD